MAKKKKISEQKIREISMNISIPAKLILRESVSHARES